MSVGNTMKAELGVPGPGLLRSSGGSQCSFAHVPLRRKTRWALPGIMPGEEQLPYVVEEMLRP